MPGVVEGSAVVEVLNELTTMAGRENPYPRYARLRETSPIVRAEDGALVVTRYADCSTVTRDPRFIHAPPDMLAFLGYPDWAEHPALRLLFTSMLALNPPDHTRLRRLVGARSRPGGCRRYSPRSCGWSTTCSTRWPTRSTSSTRSPFHCR